MSTSITWLISFFVVIVALFAAVNSVFSIIEERNSSSAEDLSRLIKELDTSVELISGEIVGGSGNSEVDLVLTNDGRRTLHNYADWIVTVRYERSGSPGIIDTVPSYSPALADNTWTVQSLWLDFGNSQTELLEQGHFNVHEELVLRIKLTPAMQVNEPVFVTLTPPYGSPQTIIFES